MDKRFFLALALSALVIVLVQLIFPQPKRVPGAADSARVAAVGDTTRNGAVGAGGATTTTAAASAATTTAGPPTTAPAAADSLGGAAPMAQVAQVAPHVTTVRMDTAIYRFNSVGAAPVSAELLQYQRLAKGGKREGTVDLARAGEPLLSYRLVVPGDTIALDRAAFTLVDSSAAVSGGDGRLVYEAPVTTRAGQAARVTIAYSFSRGNYLVRTAGRVDGLPPGQPAFLLIDLPRGIRSAEADTADDQRHLAFAFKPAAENATNVEFSKLDPGEQKLETGPFTWAAAKNKYFLVAVLVPEGDKSIAEAHVVGGARTSKLATTAQATLVQRLRPDGSFGFELYAGPQEYRRMHALGRDFENANPHGWVLQGVLQPFSTIIVRLLLWMHEHLALSYGWVLVIFAVAVRLALWPLNQNAMRSSLKMQRIQPQLQAAQERYKGDPQKAQAEMMKVYKEHGMSPFSALSGCLPMLIPMPILFTLIFVFQNTIEFRGVPFLWLHDMSAKDPYYIAPLLMGLTTYLLSWISMRSAPPNPQAKMMTYMMPVMMTVFLVNLAGGLNIYYVVQNLAALPQQWLIANERAKSTPSPTKPVVQGTAVKKARA